MDQWRREIKSSAEMSPSGTPPLELDDPAAGPPDTRDCTLCCGGAMSFGGAAAWPTRAPTTNGAPTPEPVASMTRAISEAVWMRPD